MGLDPKFEKAIDIASRMDTPIIRLAVLDDGGWVVESDREIILMNGDQEVFILPPMTEIYLEGESMGISLPNECSCGECVEPIGTVADFNEYILKAKRTVEERMFDQADPTKVC